MKTGKSFLLLHIKYMIIIDFKLIRHNPLLHSIS